jgi:hypothetical protein
VVPTDLLPCCCKAQRSVGEESATRSCCHEPAPQKSCCAKTEGIKCCSTDSKIKPLCPVCRCVELMQIVAISEAESSLPGVRLAADQFQVAVYSAPLTPAYEPLAVDAPEQFPPGIAVLQKTCVVLC